MSKNGKNGATQEAPPDPGVGIINPITVTEMVNAYNRSMRMIKEGYEMLQEAHDILTITFGKDRNFTTIATGSYRETAAEVVERQLHKAVWKVIVDKMDVWKMLSIKRAEDLRKLLDEGQITDREGNVIQKLPPITDEEILSMLEAMLQNAHDFAEEFALEVYEWLTPASKSDSRWEAGYATNKREARDELGKRVILGWMIDSSWGNIRVNYHKQDKIASLDRLFYLLDGKNPPEVNSYNTPLAVAIDQAGKTTYDGRGETDYFKFRACQNGNLHLEFKRMDLVQKLNQIAGNPTALRQKRYKTQKGDHTEVHVPNAPEKEEERREEAFFWSPAPVVARLIELAKLPPPLLLAGKKFLEPSAGKGDIADGLLGAGVGKDQITCVEKNYDRVAELLKKGYNVRDLDFLKFNEAGWDYILMNPPFNQEQDLLHVMHAYKLLAPGGTLVAVMSASTFSKSSRARDYFKGWVEQVGGKKHDLPENSFAEAGTYWDTVVVVLQKPNA